MIEGERDAWILVAAYFAAAADWEMLDADDGLDPASVELLDSMFVDGVTAARRRMQLLEERGWSGWTQLEPVMSDAGGELPSGSWWLRTWSGRRDGAGGRPRAC